MHTLVWGCSFVVPINKVHECHSYSGMQLFRMISPCSSEIRRDQEVGGKRGTSHIQLCTM